MVFFVVVIFLRVFLPVFRAVRVWVFFRASCE